MRGPPLLWRLLRTVHRRFFCRCSAALFPACGQPAAFVSGLARPAGRLPVLCGFLRLFARRALVCAGLLLPLFGLFGSPRRGAQGGAAARRLCVRFPAVMSAFCGFSLPAFRGVVSRPACSAAFVWAFTPVACLSVLCCVRGLFFFIFRLFLPHFCLSKIFSFVAQAATGLYFLPKRK